MNRDILTFASEAEWLAMREQDITSTECSALFGCSPYATEYELFHRKTGQLVVEFELNDRIKWGNRLETAIAYGIAEDLGLLVEPFKVYARITDLRMGSSFDFKVIGLDPNYQGSDQTYRDLFREYGPGIMEVKNVDGLQFRRGWITGDDKEAPPHIELQAQHQMEVADMPYTIMAPLVGGNSPQPFYRLRDLAIGEAIRAKVTEFWQRVADGRAPDPDFTQDGATIAAMLSNDNGQTVDMSENNRLAELVALHKAASADVKDAETRKDAAKAEMLLIIGENAKVIGNGFSISAGAVKPSQGKLITVTDVGQYVGGRAGYRGFRVYAK